VPVGSVRVIGGKVSDGRCDRGSKYAEKRIEGLVSGALELEGAVDGSLAEVAR
jgi:hypothetical protein